MTHEEPRRHCLLIDDTRRAAPLNVSLDVGRTAEPEIGSFAGRRESRRVRPAGRCEWHSWSF